MIHAERSFPVAFFYFSFDKKGETDEGGMIRRVEILEKSYIVGPGGEFAEISTEAEGRLISRWTKAIFSRASLSGRFWPAFFSLSGDERARTPASPPTLNPRLLVKILFTSVTLHPFLFLFVTLFLVRLLLVILLLVLMIILM